MTLVSLERIKNYIQTQINPYGEPFKGTAYEFGIKLLDYLNNKDADYDVDKVIKEIEEWTARINVINDNSGKVGQVDVIGSNKAIKIVEGGGVSGDN